MSVTQEGGFYRKTQDLPDLDFGEEYKQDENTLIKDEEELKIREDAMSYLTRDPPYASN